VALLAVMINISPLAGEAQSRDVNTPYDDAYDALHGNDLFGSWSSTISGSSICEHELWKIIVPIKNNATTSLLQSIACGIEAPASD